MKIISPFFRFLLLTSIVLISGNSSISALEEMRILVYPFENSGNTSYSWISAGMTDTVISDLSRLKKVNVITDADRKKAIREIELSMTGLVSEESTVKVGKITGANLVFTGSYQVFGKKIRVTGRLVDVASSVIRKSIKVDGFMENLLDIQDKVVLSMMSETEKLDIKNVRKVIFKKEDKKLIRKGYKPSLEAYRYYSMGLMEYERNAPKALRSFQKAVKLEPGYFHAVLALGNIYNNIGKPEKAFQYFTRAERLIRKSGLGNSIDEAMLLNSIAAFYWYRGKYRKSLAYATKTLEVLKKNNKRRSYLAATGGLHMAASACRGMGEMDQALKYYLEAKSILERSGFKRTTGYAWIIINLGALYMNKKDYRSSLPFYRKAISIWKSIGLANSQGVAYGECEMGFVYSGLGNHGAGIKYLKRGLERCESLKLHHTVNYASYNWYIAYIYYGKLNNPCRGAAYMEKSAGIFERLKHPNGPGARRAAVDMEIRCKN